MTFTLNNRFQVKLKLAIESEIESLREKVLVKFDLTQDDVRRMQGQHQAYLNMLDLMERVETEVLAEQ